MLLIPTAVTRGSIKGGVSMEEDDSDIIGNVSVIISIPFSFSFPFSFMFMFMFSFSFSFSFTFRITR